jgi:hypothetical protein
MGVLNNMISELDERTIAERVDRKHDDAREQYPYHNISISGTIELENDLGRYYAYHYERCVAPGAQMPPAEAIGRAKHIIESAYRRRGQTYLNALADGKDCRNGGVRALRDHIYEALKEECRENYVDDVFARYCCIDDWDQRLAVMKEFLAHYGHMLPPSLRSQPAERFATTEYKTLIRAYVDALKQTAAAFRRM